MNKTLLLVALLAALFVVAVAERKPETKKPVPEHGRVPTEVTAQPKASTRAPTRAASRPTQRASTLSDSEAPKSGATLKATTSVNVRSTPCTSGKKVGLLEAGKTATFTGVVKTGCGYTWYGVRGSVKGYVASKYVTAGSSSPSKPKSKPKSKSKPSTSGSYNCGQSYVSGRATGEKRCVKINNANVVVKTAEIFNKMKAAASKAGVTLHVNSGFRTMKEQQYFYNCYRTKKCNNGNLAAKPGYSNHQNGIALDINVPTSVYNWLVKNASKYGFIRTVPSEKWHWEYRPGQRCNAMVKYSCK